MKPKGLRLFDRCQDLPVHLDVDSDEYDDVPGTIVVAETALDPDQLDKLAQRCKEWSKYLRSQKGKKPVVKKWEDL